MPRLFYVVFVFTFLLLLLFSYSTSAFENSDTSNILNRLKVLELEDPNTFEQNLTLLDSLSNVCVENSFVTGYFIAQQKKGEIYYYLNEWDDGISAFNEANKLKDTNFQIRNYNYLSQIYLSKNDLFRSFACADSCMDLIQDKYSLENVVPLYVIARIQIRRELNDSAIKSCKIAYEIVEAKGSEIAKIRWAINLSKILFQTEELNESEYYTRMAISLLNKNSGLDDQSIAIYRAMGYELMGKIHYANSALDSSAYYLTASRENFKALGYSFHLFELNNTLAKVRIAQGNLKQARDILYENETLIDYSNLKHEIDYLETWVQLCIKEGNTEEGIHRLTKFVIMKDSIQKSSTLEKLHQLELTNEADRRNTMERYWRTKNRYNTMLSIFLGLFLLSCLVVIYFFNRQNSKLKHEIKWRIKQLQSYSVKMAQKNNLFKEVEDKLSKKDEDSELLINQVFNKIKIEKSIESDWLEFEYYFKSINPKFHEVLIRKFPTLTTGEIKICALEYIGLSNIEIENILNVTKDSIKSSRQRIKNKMHLNSTSEIKEILDKL